MNILTLDLGTRCGWTLHRDGHTESGIQTFDVKRGESPGMRYLRFRRWLEDVTPGVGLVIYEQTHNRGGAATEVAAGFATRVQEQCAALGIEHATVHSATLKKFTTGSGRGEKHHMRASALSRGWITAEITDDNEVDARCLLAYGLAEIIPAQVG